MKQARSNKNIPFRETSRGTQSSTDQQRQACTAPVSPLATRVTRLARKTSRARGALGIKDRQNRISPIFHFSTYGRPRRGSKKKGAWATNKLMQWRKGGLGRSGLCALICCCWPASINHGSVAQPQHPPQQKGGGRQHHNTRRREQNKTEAMV